MLGQVIPAGSATFGVFIGRFAGQQGCPNEINKRQTGGVGSSFVNTKIL